MARCDFNETRGQTGTHLGGVPALLGVATAGAQPRRLRPRLRAEGGGAPGSPSVVMGVVMLRMGGSLAGVVGARPREAARQLVRRRRERVAVGMVG